VAHRPRSTGIHDRHRRQCLLLGPGQDVPGFSTNDYGENAQYGKLLKVAYGGLNGTVSRSYNDYQGALPDNPCPA
jgi:hypothetical protein